MKACADFCITRITPNPLSLAASLPEWTTSGWELWLSWSQVCPHDQQPQPTAAVPSCLSNTDTAFSQIVCRLATRKLCILVSLALSNWRRFSCVFWNICVPLTGRLLWTESQMTYPLSKMFGTKSVSDFRGFRFWNIWIDFTSWTSVIQKSEIQNAPKYKTFWGLCQLSKSFRFWSVWDFSCTY